MALSKITNLSITDDAVRTVGIQDDNVTTAKILDNNVTLAKLGDGTQGDILYYGASGAPTRLGFGTSGDFLKTQGTGANPAWATVGGIDCDADSWLYYANASVDVASDAIIDFPAQVKLGSNVTESGGVITVGTAGWYLVWCVIANYAVDADQMDIELQYDGSGIIGRSYWTGAGTNYVGKTPVVIHEAAASGTFNYYGNGSYYGHADPDKTMTWFGGMRLGA